MHSVPRAGGRAVPVCLPVRFGWPRRRRTVMAAPVPQSSIPKARPSKPSMILWHQGSRPYRWLENKIRPKWPRGLKPRTKSHCFLDQIPFRSAVKDRLTKLFNYPKYSSPSRRGEWVLFSKMTACKIRCVFYIQKGLPALRNYCWISQQVFDRRHLAPGRLFGSKSGKYIGYGIFERRLRLGTTCMSGFRDQKTLSDLVGGLKVSGVAWRGDEGFFYSRYPRPKRQGADDEERVTHDLTTTNLARRNRRRMVYEDKETAQRFHTASVTEDERTCCFIDF